MNRKLISIGLVIIFAMPARADITLYENSTDKATLSGYADVRVVNTQGETELVDGFTRLSFRFTRDMGDGWQARAVIEPGINLVGETAIAFAGGDSFQTRRDDVWYLRLGYAGFSHTDYGSLTLGKQWGAFYDVAEVTDMGRTWGGATSGAYNFNGDGGLSGTARADKAVQYRNSFGDFSIALQAQFQSVSDDIDELIAPNNPDETIVEIEYDTTVGAAVKYEFAGDHALFAGFNEGTFTALLEDGGEIEVDDRVTAIAYRYGNYADGLYLGLFYNDAEFHELDNLSRAIPDSTGIEVFASYRGNSKWMPYVLYNSLDADSSYSDRYDGDDFHREFISTGAIWFWNEKTDIYFDVRFDSSDMSGIQREVEDDGVAVGMRYIF